MSPIDLTYNTYYAGNNAMFSIDTTITLILMLV